MVAMIRHPDAPVRVLLAGEDDAVSERLSGWLGICRTPTFAIETCDGFAKARELMEATPFDCVLLHGIPSAAGSVDWIATLHQRVPGTAIVVLAGSEDRDQALAAVRSGAQDVLFPSELGPELLVRVIRYAVERAHAEQHLIWLAQHDWSTGLANRARFRQALASALARATRAGGMVAVFMLDLDRFKLVNDSFGHAAGDALLKGVAERLSAGLRVTDTLARMGGDEFAILVECRDSFNHVIALAEKVLAVFDDAFTAAGHEFRITTSIGVAAWPRSGHDVDSLLRHADEAMYRAKKEGRNNYQFYTEGMHAEAVERLRMEHDLHRALARGEFCLHYQPVLDLAAGRFSGVEALLRWDRRGEGRLVAPGEFIPLIEETGLIVPVGEWVLRHACRQWVEWRRAGMAPMKLAVNLSPRQFRNHGLPATLRRIIEETRMDSRWLQIEITEGVLMEDTVETVYLLNELKAMRIDIAIDDFGTGYSSLSYLKSFPVDVLKIDRSFISGVAQNPQDAAIASAVINMAHSLGKTVVAEGVETPQQLRFLREQGCECAQGFVLSRPMPADELVRMLSEPIRLAVA